jgi:uncharacterized membrane protein
MDIFNVTQMIFGFMLSLFVPGYLLARIFFNDAEPLEKIGLGFVLSIVLDVALGLLLGYNQAVRDITGGITALNMWIYLVGTTVFLFIILMIKDRDDRQKVAALFSKLFEKNSRDKK